MAFSGSSDEQGRLPWRDQFVARPYAKEFPKSQLLDLAMV